MTMHVTDDRRNGVNLFFPNPTLLVRSASPGDTTCCEHRTVSNPSIMEDSCDNFVALLRILTASGFKLGRRGKRDIGTVESN